MLVSYIQIKWSIHFPLFPDPTTFQSKSYKLIIPIKSSFKCRPVHWELATTPIRKRAAAIYSVRMYNTLCVKSRSFVRGGVCASLAFPRCQGCLELETIFFCFWNRIVMFGKEYTSYIAYWMSVSHWNGITRNLVIIKICGTRLGSCLPLNCRFIWGASHTAFTDSMKITPDF